MFPPSHQSSVDAGDHDVSLVVGQAVGRYRVERILPRGGMSEVYAVRHLDLQKSFALKLWKSDDDLAANQREQLREEARLLGALDHPNVVSVTDFGWLGSTPYFVMELASGGSLADLLREAGGSLAPAVALPLIRQSLAGLDHAHQHGLVHGDIKPANILIAADGSAKLADFGVSIALDRIQQEVRPTRKSLDDDQTVVLAEPTPRLKGGTPAYLPPEVSGYHASSARADVWAVGVTVAQVLFGLKPDGVSAFDVKRDVPAEFQQWRPLLSGCLVVDPQKRLLDAAAVISLLPESPSEAEAKAPAFETIKAAAKKTRASIGGWFKAAWARRSYRVALVCVTLLFVVFVVVGLVSLNQTAPHPMRDPKPYNATGGGFDKPLRPVFPQNLLRPLTRLPDVDYPLGGGW